MIVDRVRLPRRLLWTACALALGASSVLAGCHTNENVIYGTGVVTMGDANEDFASYIVDIDDITLTRNDGLVIEPLSEPEIVDLAKLHDLTELVENPAIPVGTYTSLTLVLDYTAASIWVNVNGVATVATPVDTTGASMLTATLTVTFDPDNLLVINSQQCTRIHLDINLAASNTITISGSTVTDTVQPFMTATPIPEDSTVMRARGLLVVAQPKSSNFIVNMRPFADLISALGAMTINITSTTYFNINGAIYTGAAGLAAMQDQQVDTAVAAYGTLGSFSTITPTFNATAVYVGSALESPLADYITGVVSARVGDTLTIHGASFLSRLGDLQYYDQLPITLSSEAAVSEDGVAASGLSIQSISVGQLINVAGQAAYDSTDTIVESLDATAGLLRLQSTPVWGTLASGAAGSMALDVLSFGDYQPSVFNFAGTGPTAADDANPASYLVNTGATNMSTTPVGTLLEANGIVTPFGAAPPDFTATSVVAGSTTPQQLVVEWEDGGDVGPFTSYSTAGIVVNLADAKVSSTVRYIATGPVKTDLKTLPASPAITFASGAPLTLAIGNNAAISVFNSASGFITSLKTTLNGTNAVYRLVCVGQYSSTTNTFTATQVAVNLQQ
ncbi:MAG TPA: DUF4382 domain-containing protein [Steroidobacteraceae bacterium]|nr:DUF4382 domain-containing protein [Steroidobacteraceae bacterium]